MQMSYTGRVTGPGLISGKSTVTLHCGFVLCIYHHFVVILKEYHIWTCTKETPDDDRQGTAMKDIEWACLEKDDQKPPRVFKKWWTELQPASLFEDLQILHCCELSDFPHKNCSADHHGPQFYIPRVRKLLKNLLLVWQLRYSPISANLCLGVI